MKKHLVLAVFSCALLFFGGAATAEANTTDLSFDLSYSSGPFLFYCGSNTSTFEEGRHYRPTDGPCVFSIPGSISGQRIIAVYHGTPGSSTPVGGDVVASSPTLVQEDYLAFGNANQDDDYFAAVYGLDIYNEFNTYLQTGGAVPTGAVQNQNVYILKWKWGSKPASEYDPVVIIPGILGSWEKNGTWVLDPILHTYDNLIDTFLANGYVENKTLFKFPYDWEEPNEVTAFVLKNKIAEIKTICGCSKVDLIGHSMGGLVALQYVERDDYAHDVDQLFLVATPLSGAPKAYKTWEGGVIDFDKPISNAVMQVKFKNEARKNGYGIRSDSIFKFIQGKPVVSIQELLPVFSDYLKTTIASFSYPSGYPANSFLERLVSNLQAKVYDRGVDVKVILADTKTNTTIGGFIIASSTKPGIWTDGEPVSTIFVAGDGTVPRSSIEKYLPVDKEFDFVNHTEVASTSAPYIFKELSGNDPLTVVGKIYNPALSFLYFKLFSPINMQIIAPDGKRLGKDFTNNTELNEIPDTFYSGFKTDDEYAIIINPLPGEYQLKTIGTGVGGAYTIVADYSNTATTSEATIIGTTTPAQIITNIVNVSPTTTSISITLQVPKNPALTPGTCISDINLLYQKKWISKKAVYENLIFDCKILKALFQVYDKANKLLLATTVAGIKLTLADMDLLAKDKGNTKDAVLLINKYTTWFRNHELD